MTAAVLYIWCKEKTHKIMCLVTRRDSIQSFQGLKLGNKFSCISNLERVKSSNNFATDMEVSVVLAITVCWLQCCEQVDLLVCGWYKKVVGMWLVTASSPFSIGPGWYEAVLSTYCRLVALQVWSQHRIIHIRDFLDPTHHLSVVSHLNCE